MKKRTQQPDQSAVTAERVIQFMRSRFNPIKGLTPARLSVALDSFYAGHLRDFALLAEAIEDRDDTTKNVARKRKKATARNGYDILTRDDSREAAAQKETAENFFRTLQVTTATDRNERGGVQLMVRQMMDAVSKRYAVHEIVWDLENGDPRAKLTFVPLWFFENTMGRLRFLKSDFALAGEEMDEDGWMVTVSEGLMIAASVAYMYKSLSLKDWVIYNQRHGMPGFLGKTTATKGTEQWTAVVDAVKAISAEFSAVVNTADGIDVLDLKGSGEIPYPKLVERMDRAIASLYRGSDLSTMSAGQGDGSGASVQGDESALIEADDAALISETIQHNLVRRVIALAYGEDVEPLVTFQLRTSAKKNVAQEISTDKFLSEVGFPHTAEDLASRYGRTLPDKEETILTPRATQVPAQPQTLPNERPGFTADAPEIGALIAGVRLQIAEEEQKALRPVAERLNQLYVVADREDWDPEEFVGMVRRFIDVELPQMMADLAAKPATAKLIEETLTAAFFNGVEDAAKAKEAKS